MNISVCLDAVYNGRDIIESMKEVKELGIKKFEFWSWWDKDNLDEINKLKNQLGLDISTFCTKFASLVDQNKRTDYIEGLKESIEVAKFLGCKKLITQVGNDLRTAREEQRKSLIEGLKACVPFLEKAGITLLIEPLNTFLDHKGYYLYSSDEAFGIIDEVASPYVKVLFDIYHQQIMEGNIIKRISGNINKIGHFHAAGNPGRHELYFGELNYNEIFKAIDALGYNDDIGFEYFPLEAPAKGLTAFLSK